MDLLSMKISCVRRLLTLMLVRSLALKWFCPGLREIIFPFRVTLNLLAYDLLVLIMLFTLVYLYFLNYFLSITTESPFGPLVTS